MSIIENQKRINSLSALRERYGEAGERIRKLKFTELDEFSTLFIQKSPLCFIATSTSSGADCSPRGGEAGFVKVMDEKTLYLPDWSGNKRLDTLSNLLTSDGHCGLVFLVPRQDAFLRVNGKTELLVDHDALEHCAYEGNQPTSVIKITIHEVYFHCGRALKRSHLWEPDAWLPTQLPSMGAIVKKQSQKAGVTEGMQASEEQINQQYKEVLGKQYLYTNHEHKK